MRNSKNQGRKATAGKVKIELLNEKGGVLKALQWPLALWQMFQTMADNRKETPMEALRDIMEAEFTSIRVTVPPAVTMRNSKTWSRKAKIESKSETITITVNGDTAKALRAMAFVMGVTIEAMTIDVLSGTNQYSKPRELHGEIDCWIDTKRQRRAAFNRLKEYRDANNLDYRDAEMQINHAEIEGEITFNEARKRRLKLMKEAA